MNEVTQPRTGATPSMVAVHISFDLVINEREIAPLGFLYGDPARAWSKMLTYLFIQSPKLEDVLMPGCFGEDCSPDGVYSVHLERNGLSLLFTSDWRRCVDGVRDVLYALKLLPHSYIIWFDTAESIWRPYWPSGSPAFNPTEMLLRIRNTGLPK